MVVPTFFEDADEVRFRLTGLEGAVVDVVCFGLLLMLTLLVDVLVIAVVGFVLVDEGEVDLNCCVTSTDCDLVCNITASFPSGMAAAVGVGSLWLLRRS